MNNQTNKGASALKVAARDWKAIPAHLKYIVGGVNRVLSKGKFVVVEIVH